MFVVFNVLFGVVMLMFVLFMYFVVVFVLGLLFGVMFLLVVVLMMVFVWYNLLFDGWVKGISVFMMVFVFG